MRETDESTRSPHEWSDQPDDIRDEVYHILRRGSSIRNIRRYRSIGENWKSGREKAGRQSRGSTTAGVRGAGAKPRAVAALATSLTTRKKSKNTWKLRRSLETMPPGISWLRLPSKISPPQSNRERTGGLYPRTEVLGVVGEDHHIGTPLPHSIRQPG